MKKRPWVSKFAVSELAQAAFFHPLADYFLILVLTFLLTGMGLWMVLSSSSVFAETEMRDSYYFVKRHLLFALAGMIGMFVLSRFSSQNLRKLSWLALTIALGMLLATKLTPLGITKNGNSNWLSLGVGDITIQPSEFAKLALIIWGAHILEYRRRTRKLHYFRELLFPYLSGCALIIGVVLWQHDMGTAMILVAITWGMMWFAGVDLKILFGLLVPVALGAAALVITSPNRMGRVLAFWDPSKADAGMNDQRLHSMYALASGGWRGRGIGQSRQKWGSLAESHTDFVFAVLGEEMGLIGTVSTIGFFVLMWYLAFRIAKRSTNYFLRFTAAGLGFWFAIQICVNLAVVSGLAPVLGVPLPFLSYGGSSLVASLLAVGCLLVCARNEPQAISYLTYVRRLKEKPKLSTVVDAR